MVKMGSDVIGVHKGERFSGKLIARIHPLPGMEIFEEIQHRIELPDGKRIDVTANEFVGIGGSDAEETE